MRLIYNWIRLPVMIKFLPGCTFSIAPASRIKFPVKMHCPDGGSMMISHPDGIGDGVTVPVD